MGLDSSFEQSTRLVLNYSGHNPEAGCDEAGRGCLAGPVTAAAVVLPEGVRIPGLDDSKMINEKDRLHLRDKIIGASADWAVAHVSHEEIDRINILQASIMAMHLALEKLSQKPVHIIVDGIHFNPFPGIPHTCLPKADGRIQSVAAASILAKTSRDALMQELHTQYPEYRWNNNKGYPTPAHKAAIREHGLTPFHRRTFGMARQLSLDID